MRLDVQRPPIKRDHCFSDLHPHPCHRRRGRGGFYSHAQLQHTQRKDEARGCYELDNPHPGDLGQQG